jgi:TorA maturation chaperone TorD
MSARKTASTGSEPSGAAPPGHFRDRARDAGCADPAAEALSRALLYRLLALGVQRPEPGSLGALCATAETVRDCGLLDPGLARDLLEGLRALDEEELRRAQDRSFGHTVQGPVPLYQAEYGTRGDAFQQGHELADLGAFHAAAGLRPRADAADRPDHVRFAMEFLMVLARREADAWEAGDLDRYGALRELQQVFLRDHGAGKVAAIFRRMAREPGIVGALGRAGAAFLEAECERFGLAADPEVYELRPALLGPDESLRCQSLPAPPEPPFRELEV